MSKNSCFAFTWAANETGVNVAQTVPKELFLLEENFNFGLFGIIPFPDLFLF